MRFPKQYMIVVQENRVSQFMSWYTAQARARWNVLLSPKAMEASLSSNPLVATGTTDPVTHYFTVWPVRPDQDENMQINPPAFADLYYVWVFPGGSEPTPIEKLTELGLEPQPQEDP